VCGSDASLDAAVARLVDAAIAKNALHVGALDQLRAQAAADRLGIIADVASDDPLGGLTGIGTQGAARAGMDRGGVIGGTIGAVAGCVLAATPAGNIVAAPAYLHVLADAALYFVVGAIIGSVLGAALAPQPSTHAGFRLIDGMQDGAYALIAIVPAERHRELRQALEAAGAAGITSV
jgi:hypothetical protein